MSKPLSSYAHMCRMDHVQIGHDDSEHERCPLCRANDRADALEAMLASQSAMLADIARAAGYKLGEQYSAAGIIARLRDGDR